MGIGGNRFRQSRAQCLSERLPRPANTERYLWAVLRSVIREQTAPCFNLPDRRVFSFQQAAGGALSSEPALPPGCWTRELVLCSSPRVRKVSRCQLWTLGTTVGIDAS